MQRGVLAVSLAAALLMPVAALADPPWERSHQYEYKAGNCKYEYKSGPGGFKEEYKCDRGPRYAGGPPPWAPAHGWRRKHAQQHETGHVSAISASSSAAATGM